MKRNVALAALLAAALASTPGLYGQDNVAEAARKQAEERHQAVTARLEQLEISIAAHQKSVMTLTDEVRKVKDELDRLRNKNESAATSDGLKRLQEAIVEVDKKRIADRAADNERFTKVLEEIRKQILAGAGGGPRPQPPAVDGGNGGTKQPGGGSAIPPGTPSKGYKYAIRSGDTLSGLVKALKKEGHKVTEKIIMDANPSVNWNKLKINQEIFIPETR